MPHIELNPAISDVTFGVDGVKFYLAPFTLEERDEWGALPKDEQGNIPKDALYDFMVEKLHARFIAGTKKAEREKVTLDWLMKQFTWSALVTILNALLDGDHEKKRWRTKSTPRAQ